MFPEHRHCAAQVCLNLLHTRRGRRKRDASAQVIGGPGDASARVIGGLCDASAYAHATEGVGDDASASAHATEGLGDASAYATPLRVSATPQLLLLVCRSSRGSVRNWSSFLPLNPETRGSRR
ncbi:hypothetical protein ATANTOWER_030101 [Ataeniobius toweri]|uniref:Uncharacterized protein n=1 Tax=Ataeniobius toweri TaxID=208326 RepID=A0ABU7C1P6_9TELE|nr:hypothetical protein [Ataeniobius toweri]